jgi:hypothetical protein
VNLFKGLDMKLTYVILIFLFVSNASWAQKTFIFKNGFDGDTEVKKWSLMYGAAVTNANARSDSSALLIKEGEASVRTQSPLSEQGVVEFWIKTSSPATQYTITLRVAASQNKDSDWIQVGQIKGKHDTTEYYAKRVSVDDPGKKYLRLDFEVIHGEIWIDDISVQKILLDTALQKNQQKIITEVMDKLRADKDYEVQADALRTLGKNYAAQIDVQRQYLEYANGIYSSVTLAMATSERGRMANPLAYETFKKIVDDTNLVSSPLQKARISSLLKPLGNVATSSLNVMTQGAFSAFAEPFKSIVAIAFERSNFENAGINRAARKFAEKNGLVTYEKTEGFLTEIEKEIVMLAALDKDLQDIQAQLNQYRNELSKHLQDSLIAGGLGRGQDNYNRVLSKDEQVRNQALQEITNYFLLQAESYQNHSSSNTEFVQFMMKATRNMEETQVFKDRFNQIASSVITYYDKFERSVAKEQNPFTNEKDKKTWEMQAAKVRHYLQESKQAFTKAYM